MVVVVNLSTLVTLDCQEKDLHFLFHELQETRTITSYQYHYKRGWNVLLDLFSITDRLVEEHFV